MNILENSFIQISNLIRNSNNLNLGSEDNNINSSGDTVKKLDILSHNIIVEEIQTSKEIAGYISEESNNIEFTSTDGKYIVAFDPIDGSSNIDSNITTGSIYGIYEWNGFSIGKIVSAGYCIYGPSTILVRTEEEKVKMYQLNDNIFSYISELTLENKKEKIYSINESNIYNYSNFKVRNYILSCKNENYNTRWVGSMVSDCHRTLIKGGIFMYPSMNKCKIRLVYEAMPFAFIFEKCGGMSWDEEKSILENKIDVNNIHKKISVFLGTKEEILKLI